MYFFLKKRNLDAILIQQYNSSPSLNFQGIIWSGLDEIVNTIEEKMESFSQNITTQISAVANSNEQQQKVNNSTPKKSSKHLNHL